MVHVRGTRRHDRRREFTEYCGGDPQPAVARLGSHDVEPGVADQQHSGGESGQEEQLRRCQPRIAVVAINATSRASNPNQVADQFCAT